SAWSRRAPRGWVRRRRRGSWWSWQKAPPPHPGAATDPRSGARRRRSGAASPCGRTGATSVDPGGDLRPSPGRMRAGGSARRIVRRYSCHVDVQGAPKRIRWQEVLLLAVVTAEAIAQAVLATSSIELWRAGLVLALGAALLPRHRHWRWLL